MLHQIDGEESLLVDDEDNTISVELYFDISCASELYKKVAMMFPQRWALISVPKLQNGDSTAYPLILSVTVAYLVVILVIGVIGLKFIEEE